MDSNQEKADDLENLQSSFQESPFHRSWQVVDGFHQTRVPTTDEEVLECFKLQYSTETDSKLSDIYRVYRKTGKTIREAYEQTLRDSLNLRES
jgi:hypothetical protein